VVFIMTEVDYIETCSTSSKVVFFQKLLARLFDIVLEVTCIWCDNQSCENLSKKLVSHDKSNHITIRYHYIIDMV
jgi:hypothetical protein